MELIQVLLGSLAAIAGDPALGYRGAALVRILNLASIALNAGQEGRDQLESLTAHVKWLADKGVDPSKEDWDALLERSNNAHKILNPPPEAPPSPPEG